MLSLPSSRRLVWPCLLLLFSVLVLRLLVSFSIASTNRLLGSFALQATVGDRRPQKVMQLEPRVSIDTLMNDETNRSLPTFNRQAIDLLSRCRYKPNPHTGHVRLAEVHILNISMVPTSNENNEDIKSKRYFNPAIIPLPSYATSTPYLLISRLVTSGVHQESHVCFAELCLPSSTSEPRPGTRQCLDSDLDLLGAEGGLRCVTRPDQINIPPTPARKCTGKWKPFPDIPGFHDPRVFWSGKGEPLIEVNSGSQYGCVGLWIVDLRDVYPPLDDVLRKAVRPQGLTEREEEVGGDMSDGLLLNSVQGLAWNVLGPTLGYPYLTEMTRNPRSSRNEVEKNWILFFPSEDEMWVQYDMMGTLKKSALGKEESNPAISTTESTGDQNSTGNLSSHLHFLNSSANEQSLGIELTVHQPRVIRSSLGSRSTRPESSDGQRSGSTVVKGGRTFAQVLSHGYTTPNLTSNVEPPCFDFSANNHTTDKLGNKGHWHQGSNSLRLILCPRNQFRKRSCMQDSEHEHSKNKHMSHFQYEQLLIHEGMVVHISVIHRKFTDAFMPIRYERYILIWEARRPFQLLAVSKYPLLFGQERARPWAKHHDLDYDLRGNSPAKRQDDDGQQYTSDTTQSDEHSQSALGEYFTYTPSIAWAWRGKLGDEATHRERGHENLGTGYLDDEVIIGIGLDDVEQAYVRVAVDDLLTCMKACPRGSLG